VRRGHGGHVGRVDGGLPAPHRSPDAASLLSGGEPARGDLAPQSWLASRATLRRENYRRPPRDSLGLRLDSESALRPRLVRNGERPRDVPPGARGPGRGAAPADVPRLPPL